MLHFKTIFQRPIVQNLLFWTVSFLVLLRMFSRTGEVRTIDVIYTGLFHFPLILGVVFNQFMIRLFLKERKYLAYWSSFLGSLLIIVLVYSFTFNHLADWVFPYFYFVTVYEWYEMLGIGFIFVGLSLLFHFARDWVRQQEALVHLSKLEEEQHKAELKLLRAQINPHFLFNSLNTIYGESLKQSDKTPGLVLKLSDMLRYAVDSTERTSVKLSEELQYIKDYIDLQRERLEDPEWIHFKLSGDPSGHEIPPLLFLNIIENCFTHSEISDSQPVQIDIQVSSEDVAVETFNVIRTSEDELRKNSGSGIANTRKRLELLYPDSHTLEVQHAADQNTYHLKLRIVL